VACTALCAPASASLAGDAAQEALEERELLVHFRKGALAFDLEGKPAAARFLEAAHPEVRFTGIDRDGLHRFLVAPEHADRIAGFAEAVRSLGGTLGKVMPSPRLQELYRMRMLARRAGRPDVAGLMVRYRDEGMRKRATEARPLEGAELARFERITGKAYAWSRAMSGGKFAVRLAQPVDLIEGEAIAARLAMSPDVERVTLDTFETAQLTPNDEFFPVQWNLGTGPGGIRAQAAWDVTQGSNGVIVAVVDSGILPQHPDLAGRVLSGMDTITDATSARDGGGRDSDATDMGTYGTAAECGGSARNSSWHGTHVAGIIGANGNNGIGIAGVDWRARIVPVRSLGRCGSGATSDIVDGIAWAAGIPVPGLAANPTPARIINASLAGPGSCSAYGEVLLDLAERGGVLIAAAGNEDDNALNYRPANCALTLSVSSVGPTGEKASYSNYSSALEVSAPGGDIDLRGQSADRIGSTLGGGTQGHDGTYSYVYSQGTSQAAPHVAGVAALMLAVAPSLALYQIRDTIMRTSRPYPAGTRCAAQGDCGPGIVDAAAAVARAREINGLLSNFSALYYRSSENGWGINFQQQGLILFGTWFTYDSANNGVWYVMPNMRYVGGGYFEGPVYATTGVPLHQINGARATRTVTEVGTAGVFFFNRDRGFFGATVNGSSLFKQVSVQQFSTLPACGFTAGSRAAATNYSDLWWNAAEDGWGINFAHQGDIIFATWFTYDNSGAPAWLVSDGLRRTAPGTYTGPLYATTGRRPQDINGTDSIITATNLGSMTVTFQDGERATLSYTVAGTSGTKQITRQVWSTPMSVCIN
jgi:serine protease